MNNTHDEQALRRQLAGSEEVARTTFSVPYPYPDGAAEAWIERILQAAKKGEIFSFAMIKK